MRTEALPAGAKNFYDLDSAGGGDYVSIAAFLAEKGATAENEVLVVYGDHIEAASVVLASTGGGTITVIGNDPAANYSISIGGAGSIGIETQPTGSLIDILVHFNSTLNNAGLALGAIRQLGGGTVVGCTVGDLSCTSAAALLGIISGTGTSIDCAIRKDGTWSGAATKAGFYSYGLGTTYFYNCIDLSGITTYGFYGDDSLGAGTIYRRNCIGTALIIPGVTDNKLTSPDGAGLSVANNGSTLDGDPGVGTDLSGTFTLDINGDIWTTWQPGAELYAVTPAVATGVLTDCISDVISDIITDVI